MSPSRRFVLLISTVVLGMTGCSTLHGAPKSAGLWESRDRGRVLFWSVQQRGWDTTALCVLHLPSCSLEVYPLGGVYDLAPDPAWGGDGFTIYYSIRNPYNGIVCRHPDSGASQTVMEFQKWTQRGGTDGNVIVESPSGDLFDTPPPGISLRLLAHDIARESGEHFYLLRNDISHGPPGWRLSPDSMDLPDWPHRRLRSLLDGELKSWYDSMLTDQNDKVRERSLSPEEREHLLTGWRRSNYELIARDSLGVTSLVADWRDAHYTSLTVSADGRYLAVLRLLTDRPPIKRSVWILDRERDTVFAIELQRTRMYRDFSFSPDGSMLAATASPAGEPGLYISREPSFSRFERLNCLEGRFPFSVCWSPDGEWLIAAVENPELPEDVEALDTVKVWKRLVVVNYETLEEVMLPCELSSEGGAILWDPYAKIDWMD